MRGAIREGIARRRFRHMPHGFDDAHRVVGLEAIVPMPGQERSDGSRLANADARRVISPRSSEVSKAGPVEGEVRERRRPGHAVGLVRAA